MRLSVKISLVILCLWFNFIGLQYAFGADIVIYGDSQHNPEIQRKLVQTILSFKPSIVFRVGDIVDNGNDSKLWQKFNEIHGPLLKTTEYFPALGNHEYDAQLYFDNFSFLAGRRWYSVDRSGIHFIILDSNSRLDQRSEQYRWLALDLAAKAKDTQFTIAIFHHPLFDVTESKKSDEKRLQVILLPLFVRYGVSAVFSGHSHNYQRFQYNGIYFIITSGGGSNLRSQARTDPYLQRFISQYHFCLLTPEESFLVVKVIDINSNIIDNFKIPARIDNKAILQQGN